MADRTEIDALLISALYGELTPADEARLTAHLESHPADRTALADLTHTRATFRDSRILTVQLEPPQSVSALLLQEAARRAPKREVAGWFHRFTRSFMLHPAMAAAAMLVLVVGVAGTLYVRSGDQFSGATAPEVARNLEAPVAATAPEPETGRLADTQNGAPADRAGAAAGSGAYRGGLDEATAPVPAPLEPVPQDDQAAPVGRAKREKNLVADGEAGAAKEPPRGRAQQLALEQATKPSVSPPAPKLAKKGSSAGRGIELRSPEMAPKDFDDDKPESYAKLDAKDAKKDVAKRDLGNANADVNRAGTTVADTLAQAPGAAPSGGAGVTAVPSMMPQQNYATAPPPAADPGASAPSTLSNRSSDMAKLKAPAKTVSRDAVALKPAPAPPPPPPAATVAAEPPSAPRDSRRLADKQAVSPADAKSAEEKTTEDKALAEWVQKQREQVLAYVKSNNCRAAANAAVAIYNRAPDYYATNIATDREIKPCLPYVNNERERVDRSRAAAKRANAADTPAAAPPTRK
jgi:hypothetical protein